MSDPKIAECSAAVRYKADDGYNVELTGAQNDAKRRFWRPC